ncbi:hypothetical protein NDN08_002676 [Rhodosorus marinus]|uniref:Dolichol-phosphate mannosyltransferase subunit 3 n=1 Tax=Rhodosorus marinus TaxID=101924 RepID=A0AAV8UX58_9RHOD|nr:hypothetical protein NDN08_002676 [Rhodosorus marinus]
MNDLKKGKLVSALLIAWSALYMVVVVASYLHDSKWIQTGVSIPGYLLVVFGCYSLWTVGFGLATFPECPRALHDLGKEIRAAKDDLSDRRKKRPN